MKRQKVKASILFIGTVFDAVPESSLKNCEKMPKKERVLYSRYKNIVERPNPIIIDYNKLISVLKAQYTHVNKFISTSSKPIPKKTLVEGIKDAMNCSDPVMIIYSGHSILTGDWLIKEPLDAEDKSNYSISFEEIYDIWIKRENGSPKLLILMDSNYSGHWSRKAGLKNDQTILIQTSCRYWQKAVEDLKTGSIFLHNLFKILAKKKNEGIIEPVQNTFEPTYWGCYSAIYKQFKLRVGYMSWSDMRQALKSVVGDSLENITNEEEEFHRKMYKGEIVTNKRHGFGLSYKHNGLVEYEGNWREGKQNGKGILYSEEGIKIYEGNFKDNKRHGSGKEYYETGELKAEGEFIDDYMIGEAKEYNKNGNVVFEGEVVKYMAHNDMNTDSMRECISDASEELNNILEGEYVKDIGYNKSIDSDIRQISSQYDSLHNHVRFSNRSSNIETNYKPTKNEELQLDNQSQILPEENINAFSVQCSDNKDNTEASKASLKDSQNPKFMKIGKFFWESGKVKAEGNFLDNRLTGRGKTYYENGNLHLEGKFSNGLLYGMGSEYWDNGQLKYEGFFKKGLYHGQGKIHNQCGILISEGQFKNGMLHGKGITYYLNGNKMYDGEFEDGKAVGVGALYYNDGDLNYIGKDEDVLREAFVTQIYRQRKATKRFEKKPILPIKDRSLNKSFNLHHTRDANTDDRTIGNDKTGIVNNYRIRKQNERDYTSFYTTYNKDKSKVRAASCIQRNSYLSIEKNQILKRSSKLVLPSNMQAKVNRRQTYANNVDYMLNNPSSPLNNDNSMEIYFNALWGRTKSLNRKKKKTGGNSVNDKIYKLDKGPDKYDANDLTNLINFDEKIELSSRDEKIMRQSQAAEVLNFFNYKTKTSLLEAIRASYELKKSHTLRNSNNIKKESLKSSVEIRKNGLRSSFSPDLMSESCYPMKISIHKVEEEVESKIESPNNKDIASSIDIFKSKLLDNNVADVEVFGRIIKDNKDNVQTDIQASAEALKLPTQEEHQVITKTKQKTIATPGTPTIMDQISEFHTNHMELINKLIYTQQNIKKRVSNTNRSISTTVRRDVKKLIAENRKKTPTLNLKRYMKQSARFDDYDTQPNSKRKTNEHSTIEKNVTRVVADRFSSGFLSVKPKNFPKDKFLKKTKG